jgi:hypothetical protein
VLGDDDVGTRLTQAEHARQVELAADRAAAVREVDVRHGAAEGWALLGEAVAEIGMVTRARRLYVDLI